MKHRCWAVPALHSSSPPSLCAGVLGQWTAWEAAPITSCGLLGLTCARHNEPQLLLHRAAAAASWLGEQDGKIRDGCRWSRAERAGSERELAVHPKGDKGERCQSHLQWNKPKWLCWRRLAVRRCSGIVSLA